jgi:hypothetical protein
LNKRYRIRIGQVLRLPLEGAVTTVAVNTTAPPLARTPALEPPMEPVHSEY